MTYDEFSAEIARQLDLDGAPEAGATLVEDLGLDSLDCFNLVALVEELAGVDDNPPEVPYPLLVTMGDVHRYYREICPDQAARAAP